MVFFNFISVFSYSVVGGRPWSSLILLVSLVIIVAEKKEHEGRS